MTAVQNMLDKKHDKLCQNQEDHNSYTLKAIHEHNVVIACLSSETYDITSAAIVASQLQSTFQAVCFDLMMRIGGSVPSKKADIQLSNIVMSMPRGTFGGIVQHDYDKTISSSHFQQTDTLNKSSQVLLTAVFNLQATHEREDSQIPKFLSDLMNNFKIPEITYSDEHHD